MIQRPVAVGLTLCEKRIVEEGTGHATLVNCFRRVFAAEWPLVLPEFFVHAWLIDGLGECSLRLSVTRLDTLEEILAQEQRVGFPDPLRITRLHSRVGPLRLPVAGRY
jgi:hypothetical protein